MTLDKPLIQVVAVQPKRTPIPSETLSKYGEFINRAFASKSSAHGGLFGTTRLAGPKQIVDEIADGTLFIAYTTETIEEASGYASELRVESGEVPESATILGTMGCVKDWEESAGSKIPYYKLRLVGVNPDLWRGGIGVRLLGILEQYLETIEQESILVADCVREVGNEDYYKRRGFVYKSEEISEPHQWGSIRPFTVIRLEKALSAKRSNGSGQSPAAGGKTQH